MLMALDIKANLKMEKNMEKENSKIKMELSRFNFGKMD